MSQCRNLAAILREMTPDRRHAREALYLDSLLKWSEGRLKYLNPALPRRTAIVRAGLRPGAAF